MSESKSNAHSLGWIVLLIAFVTTSCLFTLLMLMGRPSLTGVTNAGTARHLYEARLLQDPHRVSADFGVDVDESNTKLYVNDWGGVCEQRCMTVEKLPDGYHVTLPSSYTYQKSSAVQAPDTSRPVMTLTYWDSKQHRAVTVHSADGTALSMPQVLYQPTVESVRVGETMYTVPAYVRNTDEGLIVLSNMPVWYEPGGKYYGLVDMARITRTSDGFDVCLPKSWPGPKYFSEETGIPATITGHNC